MTFRAFYLFDGYPIAWQQDNYDRWLFSRKDRIVRTRTKGQRNDAIHERPDNRAEWNQSEIDYLYVVTAEELRQRLSCTMRHDRVVHLFEGEESDMVGYNRTSLQTEFERYKSEMLESSAPHFYVNEGCNESKPLPERAEALRETTLEDWLIALKEVVKSGATRAKGFASPPMPVGPSFDTKALADIILTDNYPCPFSLRPSHDLWGFPCVAFEDLAVAMLEVIPANAECVLNVTELVENDRAYCFEDLILQKKEEAII
jgi:hypothetical protein